MEAIASTLGLNWPGLLWHLVNFVVLFFLLQRFLFKPVRGMLDARAQRVRESMAQADAAQRARRSRPKPTARRCWPKPAARRSRSAPAPTSRPSASWPTPRRAPTSASSWPRQQAETTARQIEERVMTQVRVQLADLVVMAVDRVTRGAIDANSQRGLVQQFLAPPLGAGDGSVRPPSPN